jgi:hypothetical protein
MGIGHKGRIMRTKSLILTGIFLLAACSAPQQAPVPQPRPQPAPPPIVQPMPPQSRSADWLDWPLEAGTWAYRTDARGSLALFGPAGANAIVTLRCDKGRGRIFLSVAGNRASGTFTIRTSSALKSLPSAQASGDPPYVAAEIAPADPILDAMAFSRGRFAIEVAGLRSVALPNWSEIATLIEDCRS